MQTINKNNNTLTERLTLNSIAGYDEEKAEAVKIINLFKNYEHLSSLGIEIPRGLILSGASGVGKTLMAKVIAEEAGVPFFTLENEEDEESDSTMVLKKIYAEARKHVPCIVFIDEVDKYCSLDDFRTDMSRQALKCLLTEIDGSKNSNGIMTIVTSNTYESLPTSLKRSGRFDKHIDFDMPNTKNREAILNLYLKDKGNIAEADTHELALKTANMSCADLKTLINETLLEAISSGKSKAVHKDFLRQIPLVALKGIRKKSNGEADEQVIYHELGHFICELKLNGDYSAVSIEKVGRVEGYINPYYIPTEIRGLTSSTRLKNSCIVALGGYAAEKIFLKETYNGVASDFLRFSRNLQHMAQCGMLGEDYIFSDFTAVSPNENGQFCMESDEDGTNVPTKFFKEYLAIATKIIEENKGLIEYLFSEVKERKSLEPEEIEELVKKYEKENGASC